jgi:hypothetical protein
MFLQPAIVKLLAGKTNMKQAFQKLTSNRQSEYTKLKDRGKEYLNVYNTYKHVIYLV